MNLNRKGYMLVEIVIASVLAMSIAYYLLNLTYKFKNTNEDIYASYHCMKDKVLITKNVMSDLSQGTISVLSKNSNSLVFDFYVSEDANNDPKQRKILISKNAGGKTKLQYGKYDGSDFVISDKSYYENELEASLIVGDIMVDEDDSSLTIMIPIESIYSDNNYSIKLFANKHSA